MRLLDGIKLISNRMIGTVGLRFADPINRSAVKGEVIITLRRDGGVVDTRKVSNLVVRDASVLLARLVKDSVEPSHGAYVLAIGTGDVGWDPMNPPAPTPTQRSLYSELARKTFSTTAFIDSGGAPTAIPTNVIDLTCQYAESEAVGPLVEMGIIGGTISSNMSVKNPILPPNGTYDPAVDQTIYETMFNYLTFPVINKPAGSTLTIVWRLTF